LKSIIKDKWYFKCKYTEIFKEPTGKGKSPEHVLVKAKQQL